MSTRGAAVLESVKVQLTGLGRDTQASVGLKIAFITVSFSEVVASTFLDK